MAYMAIFLLSVLNPVIVVDVFRLLMIYMEEILSNSLLWHYFHYLF